MTIRVGYVGVHIATYYAEEFGQFDRARQGLAQLGDQLGFELVAREGGVMDVEQATALARELADERLDLLIIQTAACSMADVLLPFADLGIRLGIWATPEPRYDGDIPFNSMVTANIFASTLRRYYRDAKAFKWFYGHVEDDAFRRRLAVTIGALKGCRALAESRVSWIGGLAPGFENLRFDARDLNDRLHGARVMPRELRELVDIAEQFTDAEAKDVAEDMVAAARAVNTPDEFIQRNARLYLALRAVCRQDGANAVALQDWPTMQDVYDVSPLLSLCWLAERDRIPSAHEGDVLGALSMRMMGAVAGGLPTIMDIAVIDPERDAALLWHCGGSPLSLADDRGATYEYHSTLGPKAGERPVGRGRRPDAGARGVHHRLRVRRRDARCGTSARRSSRTPRPPASTATAGGSAASATPGVELSARDLMDTLLTTGQEHHHGFVHGDISEELSELSEWMSWREVAPLRYRDALQHTDR